MKKLGIIALILALSVFTTTVYARGGRGFFRGWESGSYSNEKIDEYAKSLAEKYGVDIDKLDPEKVTETELEKLGELLFEERHGTGRDSEYMKRVMGQDDDDFKYMMRHMGYRYLDGGSFGMGYGRGGHMMGGGFHHGGRGRGYGYYDEESALDILKKRFANGEITAEEYKKSKAILEEK